MDFTYPREALLCAYRNGLRDGRRASRWIWLAFGLVVGATTVAAPLSAKKAQLEAERDGMLRRLQWVEAGIECRWGEPGKYMPVIPCDEFARRIEQRRKGAAR